MYHVSKKLRSNIWSIEHGELLVENLPEQDASGYQIGSNEDNHCNVDYFITTIIQRFSVKL